MTPEDRKQAFATQYNALVKRYGVVIVAIAHNEQFGGGEILIKPPTVDMSFVDNWQPEAVPEQQVSEGAYRLPMDDSRYHVEDIAVSPNGTKVK